MSISPLAPRDPGFKCFLGVDPDPVTGIWAESEQVPGDSNGQDSKFWPIYFLSLKIQPLVQKLRVIKAEHFLSKNTKFSLTHLQKKSNIFKLAKN